MAQLLLVDHPIVNEPHNCLDDIVTVREDGHVSSIEQQEFKVLYVNGSKADVENRLNGLFPRIAEVFYWTMDQTWRFQISSDPHLIKTLVWHDPPNKWRVLNNDFKFPFNAGSLTDEEKQILATVDINHPSVDAFINKVLKNITTDPANQTEIRELRGLEP